MQTDTDRQIQTDRYRQTDTVKIQVIRTMEKLIYELTEYGIREGLIDEEDVTYRINVLAEMLEVSDFSQSFEEYKKEAEDADGIRKDGKNHGREVSEILNDICDLALEKGLLKEDGITYRDLFDTKVMGAITPLPSQVRAEFWRRYETGAKDATDYYYHFCEATNYIRTDRTRKDEKWVTETEYGPIDISINLAKPEKDPKAFAAAGQMKIGCYQA